MQYLSPISSQSDTLLSMYQYSSNIVVQNIKTIECMERNQYIVYTKNSNITSIQTEINEKYKSSDGNPPCAGITQICGNDTCNIQYIVKLPDESITDDQCYFMPIANVTDIICDQCEGKLGYTFIY